jgi:hypothetical protein
MTELTIEQKVLLIQKQTALYKYLLAHPELQQYQIDLSDELNGLSAIQRCIVLTTKMRENQLKIVDNSADVQELIKDIQTKLEKLQSDMKELTNG